MLAPTPTLLAQAEGGSAGLLGFLPLVFIFVVFYFLLIRPQQRRQKEWQAIVEKLQTGDRVVTSGGLRGVVLLVKDDHIHLRVPPDNLRVEVVKTAVVSVAREDEIK